MTCESLKEIICFLPRNEIPFEERVLVMKHIEQCQSCKNEYQEYLKMFYLIDRASSISLPESIRKGFADEVLRKIDENKKKPFSLQIEKYKIRWVAIAAIALFLIFGSINSLLEKNAKIKEQDFSLTNSLKKNDWTMVFKIISDQHLLKTAKPEEVPIDLVLEKITKLNSQYLKNYPLLTNTKNMSDINKNIGLYFSGKNSSDNLSEVSKLLQQYKRHKKTVSLNTIISFFKNEFKAEVVS